MAKKGLKMGKKALCLIFAFSLSINTFAAVVTDNDGSAFITKAEFDSLKNNFQLQLDSYNANIDNKINNAITTYLEETKTKKTSTKNVINSEWKEVSELNGVLDNTYKVPSVTLDYLMNSRMRQNNSSAYDASNFFYLVTHYCSARYNETWVTTKNCYRNLVKTTESYPSVGDIIWDGQATRFHEKYNIARLIYHYNTERIAGTSDGIDWPWLDQQFIEQYSITMSNFTSLVAPGYVYNWDDVKRTAWPVGYRYEYSIKPGMSGGATGTKDNNFQNNVIHDSFVTEITLDTDEDGNTKRYEHIISYNNDDEWRLTNPDWNLLLNASPENGLKASDLKLASTITGECRVMGVAHHVDPNQGGRQTAPISYVINNDATIPSLGLFSGLRRSSVIYQDNEKYDITTETKKIRKDKPTLPQGFQLLAAEKDTVLEWEPIFNYVKAKDSSTSWVENVHELDIWFSRGPFSNKNETTNKIRVQVGDDPNLKDYATTTTVDGKKKCKVKFTMPEDGLVYVKWAPHFTGTSYINHYWLATLDISNCSTYKSTLNE